MLKVNRRRQAALPSLATLVVAAGIAACGGSISPSVVSPTVATITVMPSIDEMLQDKTQGSASAPNTIIEYGSFWSSNSANFHLQVAPQVKSQFVDTGRASLTFRNLFVSTETLNAAMLARCTGNANFFNAVNKIFSSQASWLGSDPDGALGRVMLGFGMSQALEDQCVANSALQNGVIAIHTNALGPGATYLLPDGTQRTGSSTAGAIQGLPAVVVNGVLLDGSTSDNAATLANIEKFLTK